MWERRSPVALVTAMFQCPWLQAQSHESQRAMKKIEVSCRQNENLQSELEDGRKFCEWENTTDLSEEYDQKRTEFELCEC